MVVLSSKERMAQSRANVKAAGDVDRRVKVSAAQYEHCVNLGRQNGAAARAEFKEGVRVAIDITMARSTEAAAVTSTHLHGDRQEVPQPLPSPPRQPPPPGTYRSPSRRRHKAQAAEGADGAPAARTPVRSAFTSVQQLQQQPPLSTRPAALHPSPQRQPPQAPQAQSMSDHAAQPEQPKPMDAEAATGVARPLLARPLFGGRGGGGGRPARRRLPPRAVGSGAGPSRSELLMAEFKRAPEAYGYDHYVHGVDYCYVERHRDKLRVEASWTADKLSVSVSIRGLEVPGACGEVPGACGLDVDPGTLPGTLARFGSKEGKVCAGLDRSKYNEAEVVFGPEAAPVLMGDCARQCERVMSHAGRRTKCPACAKAEKTMQKRLERFKQKLKAMNKSTVAELFTAELFTATTSTRPAVQPAAATHAVAVDSCTHAELLEMLRKTIALCGMPDHTLEMFCAMAANWRRAGATGRRWDTRVLEHLMHIWVKSPAAYRVLRVRRRSAPPLLAAADPPPQRALGGPYQRTFQRALESMPKGWGLNTDYVKLVGEAARERGVKDVVLVFDAVHLSARHVWSYRGGTWERIGSADALDGLLGSTDDTAKEMMQFAVRGLFSDFVMPVACFHYRKPNQQRVYDCFWRVYEELHEAGLAVRVVVADGGTENRSFFKRLLGRGPDGQYGSCSFANEYAGGQTFVVIDTPHGIKKLVNNISPRGRRHLMVVEGGEVLYVEWEQVEQALDSRGELMFDLLKWWTPQHLRPSSWDKMNVKLATDMIGNDVSALLETIGDDRHAATREFVIRMREWWQAANYKGRVVFCEEGRRARRGQRPFNHWARALRRGAAWVVEQRAAALRLFENKSKAELYTLPPETVADCKLSSEALIGLVQQCHEIDPQRLVRPRTVNQNFLENIFGQVRASGRGNTNPTVAQYQSVIHKLSWLFMKGTLHARNSVVLTNRKEAGG